MPEETGKVQHIAADEYGEYLCIVYRAKQLLYSRGVKEVYTIDTETPNRSYIDKGRLINVYKQKISIQKIHDIMQRRTASKQYEIRKNSRVDKIDRIVQEKERTIVVGKNLIEVTHTDMLDEAAEETKTLFGLYDKEVNVSTVLRVKGPVLIKPEPVTFIAERIQREYITLWGMVVVYTTGIEVYRKDTNEYKLEYIYKCKARTVHTRESIVPESRVYIVDGIHIVEMKQSGPYKVQQIEEGSTVHIGSMSMLVTESKAAYVVKIQSASRVINTNTTINTSKGISISTEKIVHKTDSTEKERAQMLNRLTESIEAYTEELKKYKQIDYAIVEDKTKTEQLLIVEKIVNTMRTEVCNNIMILVLALQEKIKQTECTAKDICTMRDTVVKKKEALADRNKNILQKADRIVKAIEAANKEVKAMTNSKSKEVEQIRERIKTLQTAVERRAQEHKEDKKSNTDISMLKQQREYLLKKIQIMKALQ